MKRTQLLLMGLGAVLLIVAFWLLLLQPQRDRLAEVRDEITFELDEQTAVSREIQRLRDVREEAPEIEAELAAAEAIVPRDAGLPAALRQLQLAADESGLVLQSVSTGRPARVGDDPDGLSRIDVQVQLVGSYFQVVDFLRRVEDPAITPRGLAWATATLTRTEEYPDLNASLSGSLYALVEEQAPEPEPEPEAEPGDEDGTVDGDADVEDVEDGVDEGDQDPETGEQDDTEEDS